MPINSNVNVGAPWVASGVTMFCKPNRGSVPAESTDIAGQFAQFLASMAWSRAGNSSAKAVEECLLKR